MAHTNYGSQAGIEAIFGKTETILESNNEADASTENVDRIILALNFSDSKIDAFFTGIFQIPLVDINGDLPEMVVDWANTIAYRHLLQPKMPTMITSTKGRMIDPTGRIYDEMKRVRGRILELNLVRYMPVGGQQNDPVMRGSRRRFPGRYW